MTALQDPGLVVPPGHGEGTWHLDVLWNWKIPAATTRGHSPCPSSCSHKAPLRRRIGTPVRMRRGLS